MGATSITGLHNTKTTLHAIKTTYNLTNKEAGKDKLMVYYINQSELPGFIIQHCFVEYK